MRKLAVGFVVVASLGVIAASNVDLRTVPLAFKGGLWSGAKGIKTAGNKVTEMLAGSLDFDFAAATITCEDSPDITVTGAQLGDPCMVGFDKAAVNTSDAGIHSSFQCYAFADTVKIRHCAAGTATNPPDAGYRVRVIGNR